MKLTKRERDTILAALRTYQAGMHMNDGNPPIDVECIASENGEPLTIEQVEKLCEKINR